MKAVGSTRGKTANIRANASKSSSSLINTAASARCGGLTPAYSRFNGFSERKGKPLKRLRFLHPTIHRAEAAVLMRGGVRIPWNSESFTAPIFTIGGARGFALWSAPVYEQSHRK